MIVQIGWSGCCTGNGKNLSSSQAQLGQSTYKAVAYFLSVSCATSTPTTQYVSELVNLPTELVDDVPSLDLAVLPGDRVRLHLAHHHSPLH